MTERPIPLYQHEVLASTGLAVPDGVSLAVIPGYDEKYWAGNDGHIYCYSDARVNARKPRPFCLGETVSPSNGYAYVSTIADGRRKTKAVHRLVALAWHGLDVSANVVRHLDGDKLNNKPANLEWGTWAQNEADKKRHGTVARGESHGNAKLTEDAVRIIRAAIPAGLWDTENAAKVFGVCPSTIRRIALGRDWKHVK